MPGYRGPEQARIDLWLTTAAGVCSLGAILYDLLTGRPRCRSATPLDTLLQVRTREPERLQPFNSQADRDLETSCLKCLGKELQRCSISVVALVKDQEPLG